MQTPTITKGTLLIARPNLMADVFNRSVVLITEHNENGTVGFVLNKSIHIPLYEFLQDIDSEEMVFEGGPVNHENLFFLHSRPDLISHSEEIKNGIYWSGNYKDVQIAINSGILSAQEIRFYLGYSGWSPKQLEREISQNAWTVINDFNFHIFDEWDSNLWQKLMNELGGENLIWSNMPENPALN